MGCGLGDLIRNMLVISPHHLQPVFKLLLYGWIALWIIGCTSPSPSSVVGQPTMTLLPAATLTSADIITPSPTPTVTSTLKPAVTVTPTLSPTLTAPPTLTPTSSPTATPETELAASPTATYTPPPPILVPTEIPDSNRIEHVVIISIDGLRPDALAVADTFAIDALQAMGAYSPRARAVLPSVTLVNHASMLGGMSPEKHGITWNENDPSQGKIKGPTLFSIAHEAGLSTAMVVGKPKLEHLVIPDSVDNYIYAGFTDIQVVNEALRVIEAGLPNILFIHLPDVDSAGHLTGWMSPGQLLVVPLTDGLIGDIVAALETGEYLDNTLLIVTSDHGGSGRSHGSESPEDVTLPWLAVGPGIPAGMTIAGDVIVFDTAATALYALELPIPAAWDGQPVLEIFVSNEE